MTREPILLLKSLGGFSEGTIGTLCTYQDGVQTLKFRGIAGNGFRVRPGDKGRLYQLGDYGIELPIRFPFRLPPPTFAVAMRRLLTPKGRVSRYFQAVSAPTTNSAGRELEARCNAPGWNPLLKKGYSWESATLLRRLG